MSPEFATALPFILIGLALLLLVIWLVARSNRKTTVIDDESSGPQVDGPDEGEGGKPTRNQALIDAPKAGEIVYGTRSANANADEIAMAGEDADAEAGVSVAPTVGDPPPARPEQKTAPGSKAGPATTRGEARARSEPRTGGDTDAAAPHPEARQGERTRPSPPSSPPVTKTSPTPEPATIPSPTSQTAPTPPAAVGPDPASAQGDDLTRIKGLGPKLATMLREKGITRFEQIANWSEDDIERVDNDLGRFKGRIRRDHWVEQARMLESGDQQAFDAKFGRTQ